MCALFAAAFWLCAACEEPESPPGAPAAPDASTQSAAVKKITLKKPPEHLLYELNAAPAGKTELLAGAEINGQYTHSPKTRPVNLANVEIAPESLDTSKPGEHVIRVYFTDENTVSLRFSVWVTGVYNGQQPLAAIEVKTPPQVSAAAALNFEQGEAELLAALDWELAEVIGYARADKSGMVYKIPHDVPQFTVRSSVAGGSFGSFGKFGSVGVDVTVSVQGRSAVCNDIHINVLNTKFKENQNTFYSYIVPLYTAGMMYGKKGAGDSMLGTEQTVWVDELFQDEAVDMVNNVLNTRYMAVHSHGQTFVPLVPPLDAAYNQGVKAVGTAAQLAAIKNDAGAKNIYVLAEDIMVSSGWEAIGSAAVPFRGMLLGNGKTVTFADGAGGGLLGWADGAHVRDVALELGTQVLDCSAGTISAARWGGVVAHPTASFFQNVSVHGSVTLTVSASAGAEDAGLPALYAGGFCGGADEQSASLFLQCASGIGLVAEASGPFARLAVGGFAGECAAGWGIIQCYASGGVSINSTDAAETGITVLAGGFAGDAGSAVVNNCYALGNVLADSTAAETAALVAAGAFAGTGSAIHTVYALGTVRADSANAASVLYVSGLAAGGTAVTKSASLSPALTAMGGGIRRLYRIMAAEDALAAGLRNYGLLPALLYDNVLDSGARASGEIGEGERNGASTSNNNFRNKSTWTQLGFDFSNFWKWAEGENRPRLAWEPSSPALP
ncbi:MAG: hypothetical protein LBC72_04420 [Spirochaetaceae bacterium]|nr:hypothetical protein [Spirochaetaceae bacterium]